MSDRKRPVSLSKMAGAACWPWRGRLSFRLRWDKAEGPAPVTDGRPCVTMMEDHELADVLAQIPALSLDFGSMAALMRTIDLLRAEPSRFTGARRDDLAAVLTATGDDPASPDVLDRLRAAAGLPETAVAAVNGDAPDA
jgi:hypothetical protein